MLQFDEQDVEAAALCAWKEARGEQVIGMKAVLCVLKNRVGYSGFPNNLHDVIFGKNQFTSMSVISDPEYHLQPAEGDEYYAAALESAQAIFGDAPVEDITVGAHYYANVHNVTSGWFYHTIMLDSRMHPITAQIGHHTFFL